MLEFDWDGANIEHIARHGVSVHDAEYVLTHPTLDVGVQDWHDEDRYSEEIELEWCQRLMRPIPMRRDSANLR